jgi:hypothetical protein
MYPEGAVTATAGGWEPRDMQVVSCARHHVPPEVIRRAVRLHIRFRLSRRDVGDLAAERGTQVGDETVRRRVLKFESIFARNLRRRRPCASDARHLDEMAVRTRSRRMDLWRAVDGEGEILDGASNHQSGGFDAGGRAAPLLGPRALGYFASNIGRMRRPPGNAGFFASSSEG